MLQEVYFKFVQGLAEDLNSNNIKLASFPEVVIRIRTALDDPETTSKDVENILMMEPVLASRLLILANSSFHNAAGIKVESLHAAVSRVGFEPVRTAAIAFAVEQLYESENLGPLKDELRGVWSSGLNLAALADSIARECTTLDPDSAFIGGLLNQIGVLYLFSKYQKFPTLLEDTESRQNLIEEWAASVGESIVANWGFSEAIQHSVNPADKEERRGRREPNLTDIIIVAKRSLDPEQTDWPDSDEAKRLQLTPEKMTSVIEVYKSRLESITSSLH